VAKVVGWADLEAGNAKETIAELARDHKLAGLRPMLQDLDDDRWILRREIEPALSAMKKLDLCLDILIFPRHLPHVVEFLSRHPDLRCVVDHAAKPPIAQSEIQPWASLMQRIARESSAFCKLSGLATEAASGWSVSTLRPYVDVLLDAFGPERLMWGSDWPVLNLAGTYAGWLEAAHTLTADIAPAARDTIFGGTALHFYRIKD
jgi:L-fuconolactonase